MQIHKSGIKDGKIVDYGILSNCAIQIKRYIDRMNEINSENMSVQEIKKFLMSDGEQISFTKFANAWIGKMEVAGRTKPAANYRTALHSLVGFCGKKELLFADITSMVIRKWIESLSETHRAKQMYPNAIKKMFEDGCMEYNDYDNNIIKVKNQPFRAVKIPFADVPDKRSVEAIAIREILKVRPETAREEFAHDMVILVFSLAGINSIDLYELPLAAFSDGKIKYNRSKTKFNRRDKAYFEISFPESLIPILKKHKGKKRLFNFSERYTTADTFSQNVNKGLKSLCEKAKTQKITVYWLRHTWATVALNKCGASIEQVAFCLNHSSAHKITETYITKEFTLVDEINRRVCEYVFGDKSENH
jgi:hypothetical protein